MSKRRFSAVNLLVISFSVINYVVSMSCCREVTTHFLSTTLETVGLYSDLAERNRREAGSLLDRRLQIVAQPKGVVGEHGVVASLREVGI